MPFHATTKYTFFVAGVDKMAVFSTSSGTRFVTSDRDAMLTFVRTLLREAEDSLRELNKTT